MQRQLIGLKKDLKTKGWHCDLHGCSWISGWSHFLHMFRLEIPVYNVRPHRGWLPGCHSKMILKMARSWKGRGKKCLEEDRDLSVTFRRINVDLAKNRTLPKLLHKRSPRRACALQGSSPDLLALIAPYSSKLYQFKNFNLQYITTAPFNICLIFLDKDVTSSTAGCDEKSYFSGKILQPT